MALFVLRFSARLRCVTLQQARVHILDTESFDSTFGPKAQRKRPNLIVGDMEVCACVRACVRACVHVRIGMTGCVCDDKSNSGTPKR